MYIDYIFQNICFVKLMFKLFCKLMKNVCKYRFKKVILYRNRP